MIVDKTTETKPQGLGCLRLFFAPFILTGIGLLGLSLYSFGLLLATLSWEAVPATLVKTAVPSTSRFEESRVELSYDYTYQGKNYNSVELLVRMPFQGGGIHKTYQKLHDYLLNLNHIQVYVDPKRPADATVYRGPTNVNWILLYMAIIWSSISSFLAFADYVNRLSKRLVKVLVISVFLFFFLSPLLLSIDFMGDYPVRGVVELRE